MKPSTRMTVTTLLVAVIASTLTALTVTEPATALTSSRIFGEDRYATSAAASLAAYPSPGPVDTVFLASGENFPDALSAGPAAAQSSAALLLTSRDSIPTNIRTEIARLAPARIVIVGGASAVSAAVEESARSLVADVSRVGGSDRYVVSEGLVRDVWNEGSRHAYVATGTSYPDALAAGPAAARVGAPVILVPGGSAALPDTTRKLLGDLGVTSVTIAGATGAVSAGIESQIRAVPGITSVTRQGGTDRYETAIVLNRHAFAGAAAGPSFLATAWDFPDALSAVVPAAVANRPIFLAQPQCVPATVLSTMTSLSTAEARLVGGTRVLRGAVEKLQPCLSTESPSSIWVVVNKARPVTPLNYAPTDLTYPNVTNVNWQPMRKEASAALESMFAAASQAGAGSMVLQSGYRSYATQKTLYDGFVRTNGQAAADLRSAKPGYSEHQTGFAADIAPRAAGCSASSCIASTPQGAWLRAHAWEHGFILRYAETTTPITGYQYEPWHYRYVGTTLAADYHAGGFQTLEAFFGMPAAPRY
ncbi:cell wall-binding repeat-containing protein [Mycetocola sp. 2940]|uniref:cell wall-binding repeat-containing protein n=1 Tax=Mycetocola sp. 2940 TaxID=3156452 RepID=UPI00339B1FC9